MQGGNEEIGADKRRHVPNVPKPRRAVAASASHD